MFRDVHIIRVDVFGQVAPAELEGILMYDERIADCGVIGVPDDDCGELPKAFIVVKENHHLTEDDVHAYMKGKTINFNTQVLHRVLRR